MRNWRELTVSLTEEVRQKLIESARQSRRWAYVPYSHYAVGAALLTASGKIYDGVNVESAAYPTTMCAERTAIFKAVSEGEREFTAIVVVTSNGGAPCGACRQVMAEFGMDTWVVAADVEGNVTLEMTVADLLPGAFRPEDLAHE
ncbi:MAG: cytidine deaminase [Anaerolineaceae bacterium]|nr:cytidine deaminase [Anaerolineaceae bacterium]